MGRRMPERKTDRERERDKTNCKTNYELEDERQMKVKNSTPRRKRTIPKLAFNAVFFSFCSLFLI